MRALAMSMSCVSTRKPHALTSTGSAHGRAVLAAGACYFVVPLGRHRNDGRIRLAEYLAIVAERRAAELAGERGGARDVGIDHRGEVDAGDARELLGVVAAHMAGANHRG